MSNKVGLISKWTKCAACGREFLAARAKICADCRGRAYQKKGYKYISDEGVVIYDKN